MKKVWNSEFRFKNSKKSKISSFFQNLELKLEISGKLFPDFFAKMFTVMYFCLFQLFMTFNYQNILPSFIESIFWKIFTNSFSILTWITIGFIIFKRSQSLNKLDISCVHVEEEKNSYVSINKQKNKLRAKSQWLEKIL